jgi:hypothetical protein
MEFTNNHKKLRAYIKTIVFLCAMLVLLVSCDKPTDTSVDETTATTTTKSQTTLQTVIETTISETAEILTEAPLPAETPAKIKLPDALTNIYDVYIDAAVRNPEYYPASHVSFDINSDDLEDILLLVNNETGGSVYCYLNDGERYSYAADYRLPKTYYKYNPNIFDKTKTERPYEYLNEIHFQKLELNGETYLTVTYFAIDGSAYLNNISAIALDKGRLYFDPIISWGLDSSREGYDSVTYRGYYGETEDDYEDISAVRFGELTDKYFKENKDIITYIPPEYDVHDIIENGEKFNDVFYYYAKYDTVYLFQNNEIIDTLRYKYYRYDTPDFFYSSINAMDDIKVDFDIPPYFKNERKMFNSYNGRISEVKFIVDGINIYDIEERPGFLNYVYKTGERSFVIYVKDFNDHYSENIRKLEFTYNPENNCFEGEYINNESPEAEKIAREMYMKDDALYWKVPHYYNLESEYSLTEDWGGGGGDRGKIVYFDKYDYSKITEEGFRTRDELMATLNEVYTPEYSEIIYKNWTDRSIINYPAVIEDKDNELYILIPDGLGGYPFYFEYYFDILSADENRIEARAVTIEYEYVEPYFNKVDALNLIVIKTPDGYRISNE